MTLTARVSVLCSLASRSDLFSLKGKWNHVSLTLPSKPTVVSGSSLTCINVHDLFPLIGSRFLLMMDQTTNLIYLWIRELSFFLKSTATFGQLQSPCSSPIPPCSTKYQKSTEYCIYHSVLWLTCLVVALRPRLWAREGRGCVSPVLTLLAPSKMSAHRRFPITIHRIEFKAPTWCF